MKSPRIIHLKLARNFRRISKNHVVFLLQHKFDPCTRKTKQFNTLKTMSEKEKQNWHDLFPFLFT